MNPEDIDLATDYLNGSLSPSGRAAVDTRRENDPAFARLLKNLSAIRDIALVEEDREAEQAISAALDEFQLNKRRRLLGRAAAAIVVLSVVSALAWAWRLNQRPSPRELFVQAFELPSNLESQMGGSANAGFEAYDAGDLEEAVRLFAKVPASDSDYEVVQFYLGAAYLGLERGVEALPILKNFVKEHCPDYQRVLCPEASWYLALGYLLIEDLNSARAELLGLVAAGASNAAQAQDLLEQLP